jgi:hypothetical protein
MDRDQRLADREEQGGLCAGSPGQVLPQGHHRKEADDADDDDGGFKDTNGYIAKGDCFVLPLDDRKQRDGGADTGEGRNHLEEGPPEHAGVGADDVAGIFQHRGVENIDCGDRADNGNNEEYARN